MYRKVMQAIYQSFWIITYFMALWKYLHAVRYSELYEKMIKTLPKTMSPWKDVLTVYSSCLIATSCINLLFWDLSSASRCLWKIISTFWMILITPWWKERLWWGRIKKYGLLVVIQIFSNPFPFQRLFIESCLSSDRYRAQRLIKREATLFEILAKIAYAKY